MRCRTWQTKYVIIIFLYKTQILIPSFQASLYVNHQLLSSSITTFYPLVLFSIFIDRGLPYLVSEKNRDTKFKGRKGNRDREREREREIARRTDNGIKKFSNEPRRFISDSANRFPWFFEKSTPDAAHRGQVINRNIVSDRPSIDGYNTTIRGCTSDDNGAQPFEKYPLELVRIVFSYNHDVFFLCSIDELVDPPRKLLFYHR